MELYSFPLSPPARKALAIARHLGFSPEVKPVDLFQGKQRSPEYLRLNPQGKVPCLVDGDVVLWESDAIGHYLAEKKGDTTLLPKQPAARADVLRWQFWAANHWSRYLGTFTFENVVKKALEMGEPDEEKLREAGEYLRTAAEFLDGHLQGKKWVTGDHLTLADFSILAFLMHRDGARFPLQGCENIDRIYGQLAELPAWRGTAPQP